MQKAIIIQSNLNQSFGEIFLNAHELNEQLSQGWKVVHTTPCGASIAESGGSGFGYAAILVIIEKLDQ